jgi:hypothetical protein
MFNAKQTMLNEQVKSKKQKNYIFFLGVLVPWWHTIFG